ncbi:delta endotoxin, N-terminal domain [Bryocella elongata]|uniref:Delta endotoxin, N-terminal domain n=1 Tax=Bryocella elongata TaxID=863522 RepID=A0A1H5U964_9BACT|nr:insecticidal delta-endotoxin Cry8Ea1 family protein [Bryocella elongata]SEF71563.1 delta endotoxin, N-terminal domain [Bryocella elongata]
MRNLVLLALLFSSVSASAGAQCGDHTESVNFQQGADYRGLVSGVVGTVPAVGSALSGVTKVLWQDNSQQQLMDALVDYVNRVVPGMIAQEHARILQEHVAGLRSLLNDYNQTTDPVQKGQYLTALLALLDELEPEFFDPRVPERTMAHFVAFGSIRLVALREQYLFARVYYGSDADRVLHEAKLRTAVATYRQAAVAMRGRVMDWRMGMIHLNQGSASKLSGRFMNMYHWWNTHDDFCDTTVLSASSSNNSGAIRDAGATFRQHTGEYRQKVSSSFGAELDTILKPTQDWQKLLDTAVAPTQPPHALAQPSQGSNVAVGTL